MTLTQGGSTVLTRWYSGSRYIKESARGVTKEYTWIGGDVHASLVMPGFCFLNILRVQNFQTINFVKVFCVAGNNGKFIH